MLLRSPSISEQPNQHHAEIVEHHFPKTFTYFDRMLPDKVPLTQLNYLSIQLVVR